MFQTKERELSSREHQVLRLYGQGKNTREVAEKLGIAEGSVDHYAKNVRLKLGVKGGISEIVEEARRRGLIP